MEHKSKVKVLITTISSYQQERRVVTDVVDFDDREQAKCAADRINESVNSIVTQQAIILN